MATALAARNADQPPAQGADARERDALVLERDALEQQLFERERFAAAVSREAADLRFQFASLRAGELEGAHEAVRLLQQRNADLEARLAEILSSTSWRASLPLRVLRNPRRYFGRGAGR